MIGDNWCVQCSAVIPVHQFGRAWCDACVRKLESRIADEASRRAAEHPTLGPPIVDRDPGDEDLAPMTVVIGKPGTVYRCPEHGDFVPKVLPRYEHDQPEAKCMAWLPGGLTYCGKLCPPAPSLLGDLIERERARTVRARLRREALDRGGLIGPRRGR